MRYRTAARAVLATAVVVGWMSVGPPARAQSERVEATVVRIDGDDLFLDLGGEEARRGLERAVPLVYAPGRPVSFFQTDVLFIHATGLNALTYRHMLAPLGERHTILAIDTRGSFMTPSKDWP